MPGGRRSTSDPVLSRGPRAAAFVCCALVAGSAPSDRRLPQDAYVWQRVWSEGLTRSLRRTAPLVSGFRVLAAEWPPGGQPVFARTDWTLLRSLGRPVVAVFRIDGRGTLPSPAAIGAAFARLPQPLAGLELDYDCPTFRLAPYRDLLRTLGPALPARTALSITVLPDWLRARDFTSLSAAVDRLVLQVHAADDPRRGLFDRDAMLRWVFAMDRRSARPFLVALPDYGVRVVLDPVGRVLSTEGERRALAGSSGTELLVTPTQMADALRALERDPPHRLLGVAWFRMPVEGDKRAWSLDSWVAVLRRASLSVRLALRQFPMRPGNLRLLRVVNEGDVDALLPARIALGAPCIASDGAGPYVLDRDPPVAMLERRQEGLLHVQDAVVVGWTRCSVEERMLALPDTLR